MLSAFNGCTALPVLSTSENGRIILTHVGIRTIERPELIENKDAQFYFFNNENIYVYEKKGLPILGFNKNGKLIFNTAPKALYDFAGIHLLKNNTLAVCGYLNESYMRDTTQFLLFNKKAESMGKVFHKKLGKFVFNGLGLHQFPDNTFIISGLGWHDNKQILFAKFKYPNTDILKMGGTIGPGYDGGGITWHYTRSIISDGNLYYIVSTSPIVRKLDSNLELVKMTGVKGNHFQLEDDLKDSPNFGYWDYKRKNESFSEWIKRGSRTIDIFHHRKVVCVIYREVTDDKDRHWCQVYSKDFETYYGEVMLPDLPLGHDGEYIYFRDNQNNKALISKTQLQLKL